ncbi:MAG: radical SAM protein, partial [Endomicrobiaceae bacterium]|nr:radical SAM protein [Endomicrobiaceae bacterium]
QDKNIDAVCIGDGEKAVINYINILKNNELNKKIDNLFIKQQDGSVLECDNSYFVDDIDSLPLIDRHMWDRWTFDKTQHKVLVERGCPYRCVYCANNKLGQVSKGNYLRYRNINSIIEEFEYIIREYPQTNSFMLYAENIASDRIQFLKLCEALKEFNEKSENKINYTIILNVTKYFVKNKEVFDAIKSANIKWVMFGFETASKEIRKKLNRPEYDNKDILKFCKEMKKRNIHTTIYAMYCYPYETRKSYNETVKWLRFFKPDAIGWFWMEPQKNTELYNRFFVRKDENYKTSYLKKLINKWHFIIFKFKVYVTYKPFVETLFLSTEQFGIGEYLFFLWRKYNVSRRKRLEKYKNIAKNYFDNKNFKQAIKYLNKIESIGDSWIYADRAFANLKLGKKEEALEDINRAIELEKDNKNYHNLRNEIVNSAKPYEKF